MDYCRINEKIEYLFVWLSTAGLHPGPTQLRNFHGDSLHIFTPWETLIMWVDNIGFRWLIEKLVKIIKTSIIKGWLRIEWPSFIIEVLMQLHFYIYLKPLKDKATQAITLYGFHCDSACYQKCRFSRKVSDFSFLRDILRLQSSPYSEEIKTSFSQTELAKPLRQYNQCFSFSLLL